MRGLATSLNFALGSFCFHFWFRSYIFIQRSAQVFDRLATSASGARGKN